MGNNQYVLSKATADLNKAKAPSKPKDIIYDPMGQWKFPGHDTRVPGNSITMENVPYPVWAQPNVGPGVMMQPEEYYNFPNADYVDEYPQLRKGGLVRMPKPSKKGLTSKAYSRSLEATNKLFTENKLFQKPKSRKRKVFDPNAKYYQNGGEYMELDLTPEEIEEYAKGGYIIEDISVPELTQAQKGGSKNYYDTDAFKETSYNNKPLPKSKVKNDNIQNKAKQIELENIAKQRYYNERTQLLPLIQQEYNVDEKRAKEIAYNPNFDVKEFSQQYSPQNVNANIKRVEPQSTISRIMDYVTNPLDAFAYSVRTGDASNMPANYRDLKAAGQGIKNNIVGDAINEINPIDAIDDTGRNISEGDYLLALGNASRLVGMGYGTGAAKALNKLDNVSQNLIKKYKQIPRQLPGSPNAVSSVDNVGESLTNAPIGNIFSGYKSKEIPEWALKQMRFNSLPELNNKQATEVLENFRTRIKTPEGQRRLLELGIADNTSILDDLKIVADDETLGQYWLQKIGLNPNLPEMRNVTRHEIEHAVQDVRETSLQKQYEQDWSRGKFMFRPKKGEAARTLAARNTTDIDELLKDLELRKTPEKVDWKELKEKRGQVEPSRLFEYLGDKQRATNYFDSGSEGQEKSAFLAEVQQYMMDQGLIPKNSYVEVTPEMVKETFMDAMFDEKGYGKYLRLFNIMKPTENNYKLISKGLNKMLSITPYIGIGGAGALGVESLQNKNNEFKNGGIVTDLSKEEIGELVRQGYVVEEV